MLVLGLMSGTSVDAIDAALVEVGHADDTLHVSLHAFIMQPFETALRRQITALLPPHSGSTRDVCEAGVLLGEAFAGAAEAVACHAGVPLKSIDLIASHGQTVYHQVAPHTVRSTLQLGSPAVIAQRTGCTVVADFRPRDIAAGGQGAPLVPYLDALLFRDPPHRRALQNIGGIGNVTYLPPDGPITAFDTGPGNVLVDEAVRLLTDGTAAFDRDGRMAAAGHVNEGLLNEWLMHPFFHLPPPKSTGREQWGAREAQHYAASARERGLSPEDTIATLTALTAHSMAGAYRRFMGGVDEVLVSGGGARNPTLVTMLRALLPQTEVHPLDDAGLDADAKEAVAFAVLGYATLHGWINNVPAATGASHAVVLGSVTPGANYRPLLERVLAASPTPPTRAQLRTRDGDCGGNEGEVASV